MRIGIDIDEVLCQFVTPFLNFYNQRHGTLFTREQFKSFRLEDTIGCTREHIQQEMDAFNKSLEFNYLSPVPGAKEGVIELKRRGHDLVIPTARPESIRMQTLGWLNYNFGRNFSEIMFSEGYGSRPKSEMAKILGLEMAIEDDPRHAIDLASIEIPVIVPSCPWNIEYKFPGDKPIYPVEYSWPAIAVKINKLSKIRLNGHCQ